MTPPEIVSAGDATTNETEPVYHPFCPFGAAGDSETIGAAGPVASNMKLWRGSQARQPCVICACC